MTLIQGLDLTNSLIGVLTRFRGNKIAFMGNIESMFYQVQVPVSQHDYLRFLEWLKCNVDETLREYHMGVHTSGAVSSPRIANYTLKATILKLD